MNKKTLMIHEITPEVFKLPLEEYILTFDDGLYGQYYYFDKFQNINTEKIYFISTDIISTGKQSTLFPKCSEAHQKAFSGNKEDFMSVDQIKFLMRMPNVYIGAHSHYHKNLKNFKSLYEKVTHIKDDTEKMLEWFDKNLNYKPTKFCFPYNDDQNGLYKSLLSKYGFTEFYGRERIPV